jgi:hypothetical protein
VNVNLSHVKEIWPRRVALQAPSDGCGAFVAGEYLVDVFDSESDIILVQRHRELLSTSWTPLNRPHTRISTSQDKHGEVSTFKRVPIMYIPLPTDTYRSMRFAMCNIRLEVCLLISTRA